MPVVVLVLLTGGLSLTSTAGREMFFHLAGILPAMVAQFSFVMLGGLKTVKTERAQRFWNFLVEYTNNFEECFPAHSVKTA